MSPDEVMVAIRRADADEAVQLLKGSTFTDRQRLGHRIEAAMIRSDSTTAQAVTVAAGGAPPLTPEEYAEAAVRHGDRELTIERSDGVLRFSAIGFDEAGKLDHQCGPLDTSPAALVRTIEWLLAANPTPARRAAKIDGANAPSSPEGQSTAHEMGYALTCAERERDEAREMHRRLLTASTQRINNLERALHKAWEALAVLNPPTIAASVSEGQPSALRASAPEGISDGR